jgi:hypothetical protein
MDIFTASEKWIFEKNSKIVFWTEVMKRQAKMNFSDISPILKMYALV